MFTLVTVLNAPDVAATFRNLVFNKCKWFQLLVLNEIITQINKQNAKHHTIQTYS